MIIDSTINLLFGGNKHDRFKKITKRNISK